MRRLGFFCDLPHGDPHEVALSAVIGQLDEQVAENVTSFLRQGSVITPTVGTRCYDVLSGKHEDIGALEILSDGTWAWPSDTAYFVEKYRALVPNDFLQHAERSGWSPFQLIGDRVEEAARELLVKQGASSNVATIGSAEEAIEAARAHLIDHRKTVQSSDLNAVPFERGWLVGFKTPTDIEVGQIRLGGLVLIVDCDGTVERTSASLPPPVIVAKYMSKRRD